MTIAMYAFSGDPITFGHIDIIKRVAKIFDEVIVAIGRNPAKEYTFSLSHRRDMAELCLASVPNVKVKSFAGLLVNFAYHCGASVIIKGVRNATDFDYEEMLYQVGESQKFDIDTHILFARSDLSHISSSAAKEVQRNHGMIHEYVPLCVKQELEDRISRQTIIGITGEMGVGKSFIGDRFASWSDRHDFFKSHDCYPRTEIHHIELDHIAHEILGELEDPPYVNIRIKISERFGVSLDGYGYINRKELGDIVFNKPEELRILNEMMVLPIRQLFQERLSSLEGLVFVSAALLAEANMLHICNNNVVFVYADKDVQEQRLHERELTSGQIITRLACQYTGAKKLEAMRKATIKEGHGFIWQIDNSNGRKMESIDHLLADIVKYFGDNI